VDSDLYVSGSEYEKSRQIAKYWKNGNAVNLNEGNTNSAKATSI